MRLYTVISRHRAFIYAMAFNIGVFLAGALLSSGLHRIFIENPFLLGVFLISIVCLIVVVKNSFTVKYPIIIIFLAGFVLMSFQHLGYEKIYSEMQDNEISVSDLPIKVISYKGRKSGYSLICRIDQNVKSIGSKKIILHMDSSTSAPEIGDSLIISGKLSRPGGASNPGGFDYERYLLGQKIILNGRNPAFNVVSKEKTLYLETKVRLFDMRERFLSLFDNPMDRAMAQGILFGDKSDIPDDIYEDFRLTGTAHILAVSGLHIGIIYSLYDEIRKRLKTSIARRVSSVVLSVFLILYGTVTLWTPSVFRAIALVFIKLVSDCIGRRYDMLSSVSPLNIVILANSPYMIYNTGFQMSFLAAYGISIIAPRLRGIVPEVLIMPITSQLFLLLYMVSSSGSISLAAVVSNIIIVYLAGFYVPIGVIFFYLYFFISKFYIYKLPLGILSSLSKMMIACTEKMDEGRFMIMNIPVPNGGFQIFYILILVFLFSESMVILKARRDIVSIVSVTVLIFSISVAGWILSYSPFNDAVETFVDVGQGDSLHISLSGHSDYLIDGGGRYDYDIGSNVLRPYLLSRGAMDIDCVFLTHRHMDHFKGIQELDNVFKIKGIDDEFYAGDTVRIGDSGFIKILWPFPDTAAIDDENYYSRIYMVNVQGIRTLVTGDITEEGERMLLSKYKGTGELDCDILKVAHHGSRFSSSADFLKECNPEIAVISVGLNNYGHPSAEVIEKLNDLGIIIYRTDMDGAVGIIPRTGLFKKNPTNSFTVVTMKSRRMDNYSSNNY